MDKKYARKCVENMMIQCADSEGFSIRECDELTDKIWNMAQQAALQSKAVTSEELAMKALKKYGRHLPECLAFETKQNEDCECGFSKAIGKL